jgi:hypothetical protein
MHEKSEKRHGKRCSFVLLKIYLLHVSFALGGKSVGSRCIKDLEKNAK